MCALVLLCNLLRQIFRLIINNVSRSKKDLAQSVRSSIWCPSRHPWWQRNIHNSNHVPCRPHIYVHRCICLLWHNINTYTAACTVSGHFEVEVQSYVHVGGVRVFLCVRGGDFGVHITQVLYLRVGESEREIPRACSQLRFVLLSEWMLYASSGSQ